MFFTESRLQFFKPLVSKYREHINQCLCLLYQRQYGSSADYGHSLRREQVIEIFEESLIQSGDIVLGVSNGFDLSDELVEDRFKNTRDHANWILKQLVEQGWIERQVDSASMLTTYPFSRMGRIFSQALLESDSTHIRTRHRNTRNTLNALEAFITRAEIHDLLDANECSERIITDFTDVIAELEEKKRALVQEMDSQQLVQQAAEQFFDFMEKRFQPDIQVRLSADSVEKYREDINNAIQRIRRQKKEFKANAERQLRRTAPGLCESHQSYLLFILDNIERRMHNAAEVMLPALRRALHGFTKRADIIIRQLSYLNTQQDNDFVEVCRELADINEDEYESRMNKAASAMASFNLQLIDPQQIKLTERKVKEEVDSSIVEPEELDRDAQCDLLVQQLLDQAFIVNSQEIRDYVVKALRNGRKVSTRELPVIDAPSLLAMAHVIEIGATNNLSSQLRFKVESENRRVEDHEYYESFDEFSIELIDRLD